VKGDCATEFVLKQPEYVRENIEHYQFVPRSSRYVAGKLTAVGWVLMLIDREGTPIEPSCNCDLDFLCNYPPCQMRQGLGSP
jgi:hypothetical protein